MISKETIEEVKERIDIVDVISDFLSLKKSGHNYRALSPFTGEKTPSFFVVPNKGIFKDFSSGKGGDAITFVMEHEGMGYLEAIRFLAKKYGVEIKEEASSVDKGLETERDSLYILMNFAKNHYVDLLHTHEDGKSIGLSYFRERGFNDVTIQRFELGYSLDSWDGLINHSQAHGYRTEMLEKAGLAIHKEGGKVYDRFRGRVMFPVHNLSGKTIAFGARMMGKEKDQPKYINSPETDIYHKSKVLYGLFQAKNAIRRLNTCYLVEGYTDVISLHQAGIENVVASSGTALTEEQIKLIHRFTENVTVLFDGDAAGIKAALRGIDLVLKEGLNVRVVLLPDGDDPDSFSKKMGSTQLEEYLKAKAKDFISFKIDVHVSESGNDPIKKAEAIRDIVASIAVIPDPIKRSVYLQETSHLLKIDEGVLIAEINKALIQDRRKQQQETQKEEEIKALVIPPQSEGASKVDHHLVLKLQERETVRLLLNYAESSLEDKRLFEFLLQELDDVEFSDPLYKKIFDTFREKAMTEELADTYYFMETGTDELKSVVAELSASRYETSPHWSDKFNIIFQHEKERLPDAAMSNVLHLKFRLIEKLIYENLRQMKEVKNMQEEEQCFIKHERLKKAQVELASQLGIVISR